MAASRSSTSIFNQSPRPHRILIGISGSIAAYKMADVVSQLRKLGHEVKCILTSSAKEFVTPTVLETLSGNPVHSELFGKDISGTEHIRLARFADVFLIAPTTANLLAKLSLGLADDLLTTVALATEAPLVVAPAMNTVMWKKEVVQAHVQALTGRGTRFIYPDEGMLACGEEGDGKLASPDRIVSEILSLLTPADLSGMKFLITSGPTVSHFDAVRYMTNPSTGKMGTAIAEEAVRRGAEVRYITGKDKGVVTPRTDTFSHGQLKVIEVNSAEEMAKIALRELPEVHGVLATSAVLDYKFTQSFDRKAKRGKDTIQLDMEPSVDVLATLKRNSKPHQWFFGFAAETDDLIENARKKLEQKGLDYVFVNLIAPRGQFVPTGFGSDTNGGFLLRKDGPMEEWNPDLKPVIAKQICDLIRDEKGIPEIYGKPQDLPIH